MLANTDINFEVGVSFVTPSIKGNAELTQPPSVAEFCGLRFVVTLNYSSDPISRRVDPQVVGFSIAPISTLNCCKFSAFILYIILSDL